MKEPKVISEKIKFKSEFLKVISTRIKLPNGNTVDWNYNIFTNEGVSVVPIDNKNNVYLSREWRPAWKRKITVIPTGVVNAGYNEKQKLNQARNELREEIGFDAKKIEKLVTILLGTRTKCKHHVYLATGLFKSPKKRDPDEIVEVVKMPLKKAYTMFLTGKEETTSHTLLGIVLAKEKLGM